MSDLYRAQVLLESQQHEALSEIAELEGRSISDLLREIVRDHLAERSRQARKLAALQAIERLTEIRTGLQTEHGLFQGDLLAEVRAEWEDDIERVWQGDA